MNLGLDIRGGARLSYDVQIGAAIAQRRDHAIENIREQLARDFSFHRGEGRLTEEGSTRLSTRVTIRRTEVDNRELTIRFVDAHDASRITRSFFGRPWIGGAIAYGWDDRCGDSARRSQLARRELGS